MKSNRAKACAISAKTKRAVAKRDSIDGQCCCIICGSPYGRPEAHYIPRSQGGLGVEENIATLCNDCHRKFDQGTAEERAEIGAMIEDYLKSCYRDWDKEKLVYRKYE